MVKRRDISESDGRAVARTIRELKRNVDSRGTGASGVKVFNDAGSVRWHSGDGIKSLRDVEVGLDETQGRLDDAALELESVSAGLVRAEEAVAGTVKGLEGVEAGLVAAGGRVDKLANDTAGLEGQVGSLRSVVESVASSVDGKNRIVRSANQPSGSDWREGDLWLQHSLEGHIVGQWVWGESGWVSSRIDSDLVESLTADKLSAPIGGLQAGFVQSVAADSGFVKELYSKRLLVSDGNLLPDSGFGSGLWALQYSSERSYASFNNGVARVECRGGNRNLFYGSPFSDWGALPVVEPGASYRFRVDVKTVRGGVSQVRALPRLATRTGRSGWAEPRAVVASRLPLVGQSVVFEGVFTVPSTGTFDRLDFGLSVQGDGTAVVEFSNVSVVRVAGSTLIEPGAITTPKLNVTDDMSAAIVNAMTVNTKRLVASEEVVASHAKVLGDLWADTVKSRKIVGHDGVFTGSVDFANVNVTGDVLANMILSDGGLIAGQPSGDRVEITNDGLVQFALNPDGIAEPVVSLGSRGGDGNIFTAGTSIISDSSISSDSGTFDKITVGGKSLEEHLEPFSRGVIVRAVATEDSQYDGTGEVVPRLYAKTVLQPDRLYKVAVDPHFVFTRSNAATDFTESLRIGSNRFANARQVMSARFPLPASTVAHAVSGLAAWIDTTGVDRAFEEHFWFATQSATGRDTRVLARAGYPVVLSVMDYGSGSEESTTSFMYLGTPRENTVASTPVVQQAPKTRTTSEWRPASYHVSSGNGTSDILQGKYGSYPNRWGGWVFPGDMVSALRGSTIHKFEVFLHASHWALSGGGTAEIRPHAGGVNNYTFGGTNHRRGGWPRNTGLWVTLPAAWYPHIASNTYKGVGVKTDDLSLEFYGRFSSSATRFRVNYSK